MKLFHLTLAAALLAGCGSSSETQTVNTDAVAVNPPPPAPIAVAPLVTPGLREPGGQAAVRGPAGAPPPEASFVPLGVLRPGDASEAFSMSGDGTVVTGTSISDEGKSRLPFRWTRAAGLTALPVTELRPGGEGHSANADGSVLGGLGIFFDIEEGWLWPAAGGIQSLPGGVGQANVQRPQIVTGLSADGRIAVGVAGTGFLGYQGFRWVQGQPNPEGLGFLGGSGELRLSNANGCSDDGNVITGQSTTSVSTLGGFVWRAGTGMAPLPALPNLAGSVGWDVAPGGDVVVGWSYQDNSVQSKGFPSEATAWRASGPVSLGLPSGYRSSVAYGVSSGGEVIVGAATNTPQLLSQAAFVWDADRGIRLLQDVLGGHVPAGWTLLVATDVSANGEFVSGFGVNPNGEVEAFWADLP